MKTKVAITKKNMIYTKLVTMVIIRLLC